MTNYVNILISHAVDKLVSFDHKLTFVDHMVLAVAHMFAAFGKLSVEAEKE